MRHNLINRTRFFWMVSSVFLLILVIACVVSFNIGDQILAEPVVLQQTETPTATLTPIPTETPTPTPDPTAIFQVTQTAEAEQQLRIFDQFIEDMKNDNANQVTGIYVENVMALQVVQQPAGNPGFVSTIDEVVTYFLFPWQKAGNHGLLAHNYLAGRYFFNVGYGDIITLVFGDGYYQDFEVTQIKDYQALQPDSPYSNFIDLETGEQKNVNTVFIEVYMGNFHTTLQTCIAQGNEGEWGRHFILAPPL